jgi:pyruvate formate lyase activating enzyme
LNILGLAKTTLLDYPGRVAATVFLGGCNFRCPYCHNMGIVLQDQGLRRLDAGEVMTFLEKRRNVLTGVCISGGEPTLNGDLADFIRGIKALGYYVKLDTNGSNPDMLRLLIEDGLIDYCAMDIKNRPEKYPATCGLSKEGFDIDSIKESVELLKQGRIGYEFRTTVARELHCVEDLIAMARWVESTNGRYFLQMVSDDTYGFHRLSTDELTEALSKGGMELRG